MSCRFLSEHITHLEIHDQSFSSSNCLTKYAYCFDFTTLGFLKLHAIIILLEDCLDPYTWDVNEHLYGHFNLLHSLD